MKVSSNKFNQHKVIVLMGSKSDWPIMKHSSDTLKDFDISHECRVLSAHRTPEALQAYIKEQDKLNTFAYIAAAGGAAHLAGVVAAHTIRPVLAVPIVGWSLDGLDSLLSTVQMPRGIPVGTFAIGKPGAINAALFAIQLLSISFPELKEDLLAFRQKNANTILTEELE